MEYIVNAYTESKREKTIEFRAARLSGLTLKSVHGGGMVYVYTDCELNSIQREFKKMIKFLISEYESGRSCYNYYKSEIESSKNFLNSITKNRRLKRP